MYMDELDKRYKWFLYEVVTHQDIMIKSWFYEGYSFRRS